MHTCINTIMQTCIIKILLNNLLHEIEFGLDQFISLLQYSNAQIDRKADMYDMNV